MTQISRFWNGTSIGDALTEAPYDAPTEFAKVLMSVSGSDQDTNKGSVWATELNELAPSAPGGTTVRVASGRAMVWGSWYENDANIDTSPAAPGAATRIDRYVLRKDWAAQTVRLTRIAGVEGGGAPALVQSAGTTWDYPICQASTTTGGVVTITDQRTYFVGIGANTFTGTQNVATGELQEAGYRVMGVKLARTVLGADTASINFTSIPSGYRDLLFTMDARTDVASTGDGMRQRINGDTGNNYDMHALSADGTVVSGVETFAGTSWLPGLCAGGSANAGLVGIMSCTYIDYASTTFNKMALSMTSRVGATSAGNLATHLRMGHWRSTAAINAILTFPNAGANFKTGTELSMYGLT